MRFFENPSPLAREFKLFLSSRRLSALSLLCIAIGLLILVIPATQTSADYQNTGNVQAFGNTQSLGGGSAMPQGSKAQDLSTSAQDSGTSGNQTANTDNSGAGSASTRNQDTLRYPQPISPLLRLSVTPSVVDVTKGSAMITITSADGSPISEPAIKAGDGLTAFVEPQNPPADFPGGLYRLKTWTAWISRINYSSSGDTMVTFSAPGGGSGEIRVTWNPAPQFTMTAGAVTRTDDTSTITYTVHFTLQPNNPYFGQPQITMQIINTPQCTNTSSLTKVMTYDGTNDYSLDCTVQKAPVWQPGDGSAPPPAAGSLNITVNAYGNLPDGSFIKGPSRSIYFNTQAPFNQ